LSIETYVKSNLVAATANAAPSSSAASSRLAEDLKEKAATVDSSHFLDWRKRPQEIEDKIERVFRTISQKSDSKWLYNGASEYLMLEIREHSLIKAKIKQSTNQKDFYVLDIGAGAFQWGRSLAEFINKQDDLPKDITVSVIGIRGEGGLERQENAGKCRIYEFTAFKVENLFTEFKKRGLYLENKLDLVISRWSFRHLVDPLGTFIQTYNLLRPETGLLLMDGFCFFDKDDTWKTYLDYVRKINDDSVSDPFVVYLITLLVKTKAPFLLQPWTSSGSLWRFILRKPNDAPCQLEMSYKGLEYGCQDIQIESECITKFDIGKERYDINREESWTIRTADLYGDESLYNWLRKNELFANDFYGKKMKWVKREIQKL